MTWSNRVVWLEGMFLRAQHFQQQDRWLEALVRDRTAALRPHAWGLTEGVDQPQPAGHRPVRAGERQRRVRGRHALRACRARPTSRSRSTCRRRTRNAVVYLVAADAPGRIGRGRRQRLTEGRYEQRDFEAYDTHSGSPQPAEVQIGRLRLRYMLETDNRAGYHGIGLARVVEVGADRRVTLDDQWIPPALACSAAPPLTGLLAELAGMLNQRGEALAARLTAPGSRGVADVSDFLLLQSVNRCAEAAGPLGERRQRPSRRSLCGPRADGGRFRDFHRGDAAVPRTIRRTGTPTCSAASRRSSPICAARCRPSSSRPPSRSRCRSAPTACGSVRSSIAAILRVVELRAGCPGRCADRDACGGCSPRRSRSARSSISASWSNVALAGNRRAAAAGRAAAAAVLRRRDLLRARPQFDRTGSRTAILRRLRRACLRRFPESQHRAVGDPRLTTVM